VVELDNPGCCELFLRIPVDHDNFQSHSVLFKPSDGLPYTLDNGNVRFNFRRDQIGGFHLDSFERLNVTATQIEWTNREWSLWQAILFHTIPSNSLDTSLLLPQARFMNPPVQVGNTLTLSWIGQEVGGIDFLNVTITLELRTGEDWLRASGSFGWQGTPTNYALDSTSVLPLRIAPQDRGSDFAVIPCVFGVLSEDPIQHLRYNPENGQARTTFGNHVRNLWNYPSGRGYNMGFWGYYTSVTNECWMGWTEQWDLTQQTICFQSDGENMILENFVTCEDNVQVGNNGRTIETVDWCVGALLATQDHAWWDIANHYKQRLEEVQPSWLVPQRPYREDLSDTEKGPFLFLDVVHSIYTGTTAFLPSFVQKARTAMGVGAEVPSFLILESGTANTLYPHETETGDARTTFSDLRAINCFAGQWRPGFIGPQVWDAHNFTGNDLRWWTTAQALGALRASRTSALTHDAYLRLSEGPEHRFYEEQNYPIVSWNAGSKVLTITGDPTSDPLFTGFMSAILIPASTSARLATATIVSIASGSLTVSTNFLDILGNVVVPTNADTVEIITAAAGAVDNADIPGNGSYCPHAQIHSASYLAKHLEDSIGAAVEISSVNQLYFDVFTEPITKQPLSYWITCYRDHTGWAAIDGGYTQHPLGGGAWYVQAQKDYIQSLRDAGRDRQQTVMGQKAFLTSCEDIDETMHGVMDYCWHTVASGDLFRVTDGLDPSIDKYKAIPLYAVVHAGRTFGRSLNHEFSSVMTATTSPIALPTPPKEDTLLHRTMAYYLGSEWVYGLTVPTLSFWADNTNGGSALDLFNDTLYVSAGGSVYDEVKNIRDLWVQMNTAEVTWIQQWLRYGEFLPPASVDFDGTDWTTGYADSFYTGQYVSYDVLYERDQYPNIVHAVWRSQTDGSVLVLFTNWTAFTSAWSGTISLDSLNLGRRASTFRAKMLDFRGDDTGEEVDFDPTTGGLSLIGMAPFSVSAVLLTPTVIDSSLKLIATWRKGNRQQGQLQ
jgi:hypothetical protein